MEVVIIVGVRCCSPEPGNVAIIGCPACFDILDEALDSVRTDSAISEM